MERQYRQLCKNLLGIGAVLLCVALLPSFRFLPVSAQTQPADTNRGDELDTRIQVFFDALSRGNSTSAFNELLRSSPLLGSPDGNEALTEIQHRVEGLSQFGNIINWEKLDTRPIGTSITLVRYVLMYDQYPVVWTFTIYRKPAAATSLANPGWGIVELHFSTDIKNVPF